MNDGTNPEGHPITIAFPEITGGEASSCAAALTERLKDIDPDIIVTRTKQNPDTQDPGTILTIVLSSTPAIAVATGLAAWIRMRRVTVRISTKEESVDVKGSGQDAARIIEAVFKTK